MPDAFEHVCYCDEVGGEFIRVRSKEQATHEFYVTTDGVVLMRRSLSSPEDQGTACMTGTTMIEQFCRSKGCKMPDATARLLQQQQQLVAQPDRQLSVNSEKGSSMKNENGKSVRDIWDELFIENENRKEKWTDEQIAEEFKTRFPSAKGDIRPAMHRSAFNAGSYGWASLGNPEKRGVPVSRRYDEQGREIPPGKRKAVVDNETGDPDRIPLSRFTKKPDTKKKKTAVKKTSATPAAATKKTAVKKKKTT
jgi:hypothetical protein